MAIELEIFKWIDDSRTVFFSCLLCVQYLDPMDDLVEFLHNIHLEHLAEIFKNEEISLDLLQKMTDNELKEIGITKFGNRKRILNAVQQNSDPQGFIFKNY